MTRTADVIYLDYNATTPLADEVWAEMEPLFRSYYANAASAHGPGREAARRVEHARAQVADLIGANPQEVVFTSGATESNNIAILGAVAARPDLKHVVTVATEHKAVLDPVDELRRRGYDATVLAVDDSGSIDLDLLASSLRRDTLLVSVMAANNETGTLAPIESIATICRTAGVLMHSDASQLAGKLPIDVGSWNVDMLSLSAHKFYGPKGVGALYVRRRTQVGPVMFGGGHERGLRSGTLNVPAIVGMGRAADLAAERMEVDSAEFARLRIYLMDELTRAFPSAVANGHKTRCLPGTLNVRLVGLLADDLQAATPGVAVSSGSACTAATPEPSHVLRAMGLDWDAAQECIRFGIGRPTTQADLSEAVARLRSGADRLSSTQPRYFDD